MGWSCRKDAMDVLDKFSDLCVKSTGSSNMWVGSAGTYFYETSRVEHEDGSITGSIYHNTGQNRCCQVGSFKIEGDGRVTRGPAILRHFAKKGESDANK